MKAALFHAFGQPLSIQTLPDPTPPPDGVVIRVRANGICRSDWHGWQGHDADIHTLPHIPGHELAGEVVAVGADVKRWRESDRVTVPFCLGCGTCPQCATGNQQICDNYYQPGFTGWGSFAEYVALPYADVNLVRIPDALDYVDVASLGCRFITAFRAVVVQGKARAGEWVVVYGCGGVGLSAVMIAASLGARVIAVDIQPGALALANSVGAEFVINSTETHPVEAIHSLTHGGVHVALDALGSAATCRDSILSLRKRGRQVQVGLLAGADANPPLPMGRVISWELELYGSHGMQAHAFGDLLNMIQAGTLQPHKLVTQRVSLAEAPAVLDAMTRFGVQGVAVIDRF